MFITRKTIQITHPPTVNAITTFARSGLGDLPPHAGAGEACVPRPGLLKCSQSVSPVYRVPIATQIRAAATTRRRPGGTRTGRTSHVRTVGPQRRAAWESPPAAATAAITTPATTVPPYRSRKGSVVRRDGTPRTGHEHEAVDANRTAISILPCKWASPNYLLSIIAWIILVSRDSYLNLKCCTTGLFSRFVSSSIHVLAITSLVSSTITGCVNSLYEAGRPHDTPTVRRRGAVALGRMFVPHAKTLELGNY